MKLVAFGESFTVGQNMEYQIQHCGGEFPNSDAEYHKFSYVSHIFNNSRDIFTDLVFQAGRGWNNDKIWFEIRNYFQNNACDNTFVIIGWTSPTRYNFYYDLSTNNYIKCTGIQRGLIHKLFEVDFLSYTSLVFQYETLILAAHSYLKSMGVRHFMIQSFHDHKHFFKLDSNKSSPIISFDSKLLYWPNWSSKNNTLFDIIRAEYCNDTAIPMGKTNHDKGDFRNYSHMDTISACFHPSPKGYRLIADTLQPLIRKILTDDYLI